MMLAIRFLLLLGIFANPSYAIELPDFTILAEEQGNKVVNISSIVERSANNNNIPFQDERMQEFFKRFGIPNFPGIPPQGGEQVPQKGSMEHDLVLLSRVMVILLLMLT